MELIRILAVGILYFLIGLHVADSLDRDDPAMSTVLIIAWPAMLTIVVLYAVINKFYGRK